MKHNKRKREIEAIINRLLHLVSENPKREGLVETPKRVARMLLKELCSHVAVPVEKLVKNIKVFREESVVGQIVAVREVTFSSMCEHHMLPFFGVANIVYIPNGKGMISGLSKVARVLDKLAARPQVQERLTAQLFTVVEKAVQPTALLVLLDASHLCMTCRGVKKVQSRTSTVKFGGLFNHDPALRRDALALVRQAA